MCHFSFILCLTIVKKCQYDIYESILLMLNQGDIPLQIEGFPIEEIAGAYLHIHILVT